MKLKPTVILAIFVVTMGLVLGTSTAQAATVNFDPNNSTQATGIENLDIGGTLYNVAFTPPNTVAAQVYGPFPGTFDFGTLSTALDATNAVNAALTAAGAITVGAGGSEGVPFYRIGYDSATVADNIQGVLFWEGFKADGGAPWARNSEPDIDSYDFGVRLWATFTLAEEPPDGVTIGGSVTGLVGSGLVLQNNGRDDLSRDSDGPFEFATPLTPGSIYNVTVRTQPSNPTQTCSVANGSGTVPTTDVTDVAVTCAEPVLGDLVKVAAEGDTLADSTVLTLILKDAGVAINIDGQVAFGGRDDDGTDAAFTQDKKVAAEGDTLQDGTILSTFRAQGEVAIGDGQSGGRVAFHGKDDTGIDTVFTQAGKVAAEGDALTTDTTLDEIEDEGKVAINNFNQLAFHGRVEIEGGLADEKLRAVFVSNGQTTQVAAQEGSALPDGTTVGEILETGGVAISDANEVAFIGRFIEPGIGGDSLRAVFTSNKLVVKEGDTLEDGTILDNVNEDGGVAINLLGKVAFHGTFLDPDTGVDAIPAVFTKAGVVVKEGDTLPDGTTVDEITAHSGVAINISDDVVFHGRTGNVQAVFSQNGLVAKVGDNLADGKTTLRQIWEEAGVAINPYGAEVAFHGGVDNLDVPGALVDAVFVGQVPTGTSSPTP